MDIFYDSKFLEYQIPAGLFDGTPSPYLDIQIGQPEGPERIQNTVSVLKHSQLDSRINWKTPSLASDEDILAFHTPQYLERLEQSQNKSDYLTTSTYMFEGGMETIRLSAGAAIGAMQSVIDGCSSIAYAISRPPSHHAQPDEADGYCFLNGIGMAVVKALNSGYSRIAVIDWDVHHGNGTQAGFYDNPHVLTFSIHMDHQDWGATHLQTGDVDEIGAGSGKGFNINLPLPFGSGDTAYQMLMDRCITPAIDSFQPDLIVIANGQDANQFDPNGRQCLTMAGYYQLARSVMSLAKKHCDGKVFMTQEGGYKPSYAPFCAYSVVAGLLGESMEMTDTTAFYPDDCARAERDVTELLARHPLA